MPTSRRNSRRRRKRSCRISTSRADPTWDAATAPAAVTHAIHMLTAYYYEDRGDGSQPDVVAENLRAARGVSRSDGGLMARGDRRHLVTFQAPTTGVDADGNYTQTWTDLVPPTGFVSIEPATTADLERVAAGTVDQLGLAPRAGRLSSGRDDRDADAVGHPDVRDYGGRQCRDARRRDGLRRGAGGGMSVSFAIRGLDQLIRELAAAPDGTEGRRDARSCSTPRTRRRRRSSGRIRK